MEIDYKAILDNYDSLILARIPKEDHILYSQFEYLTGDFSFANLPNYNNFQELISAIYRNASICEGFGYYEYCNQIRESVYKCIEKGEMCSYILPLIKNKKAIYFLMNLTKKDDDVYALFVLLDNNKGLFNFEQYTAGTFKDSLTGLFNYNTLVNHIKGNFRDGFLCLFDLNGFKLINDKFGHETGDDVLKSIGDFLIGTASMQEVYYRRSGDEFMILVFEGNLDHVLEVIDRIEKHIESIPSQLGKDFVCSAAFGILELKGKKPYSYEVQSKLTDLAMYQAKKAKKKYHFISYEDSKTIIEQGDLDERIHSIELTLRR